MQPLDPADQTTPASAAGPMPPGVPFEAPAVDPEQWPEAHGDLLFAFALSRVRDPGLAQDLVQEAFLAALKARSSFRGQSTERAWLLGILRNKLIDHYRRQQRQRDFVEMETLEPEDDPFENRGPGKDGWRHASAPRRWSAPDEALMRKEFHEVLRGCVGRLPAQAAMVFQMREVDDISSEEICKELGLSPNNLWVILHRSRMALRRCLEANWFGRPR